MGLGSSAGGGCSASPAPAAGCHQPCPSCGVTAPCQGGQAQPPKCAARRLGYTPGREQRRQQLWYKTSIVVCISRLATHPTYPRRAVHTYGIRRLIRAGHGECRQGNFILGTWVPAWALGWLGWGRGWGWTCLCPIPWHTKILQHTVPPSWCSCPYRDLRHLADTGELSTESPVQFGMKD